MRNTYMKHVQFPCSMQVEQTKENPGFSTIIFRFIVNQSHSGFLESLLSFPT